MYEVLLDEAALVYEEFCLLLYVLSVGVVVTVVEYVLGLVLIFAELERDVVLTPFVFCPLSIVLVIPEALTTPMPLA